MSETEAASRGRTPLRGRLVLASLILIMGLGSAQPAIAQAAQAAQGAAALAGPGQAPAAVQPGFPFELDLAREAAIGAGALGFYGASLYFQSQKPSARLADIRASDIPFFDRLYTTSHSVWMGTAADALMIAAAAVPELAAAGFAPGLDTRRFLTIGVMYVETLGLAYTSAELMKSVVTRYRPYAYSGSVDLGDGELTSSFPSRHAMIAFSSAVFAGYAFDQVAPGSPWSALVWASGLGLATATSVFRIASGDHFLSDVVAGAAFGAGLGLAVPLMHRTRRAADPDTVSATVLPVPAGLIVRLELPR
jgi:undecaprenyl-diphosphatase